MGVVPSRFLVREDFTVSESQNLTGGELCTLLDLMVRALKSGSVALPGEAQSLAGALLPMAALVLEKIQPTFPAAGELVLAPQAEIAKLHQLVKEYQAALANADSLREAAVARAKDRVTSHAATVWRQRANELKKTEDQLSSERGKLDLQLRELDEKRRRLEEDIARDRKSVDADMIRLSQLEIKLTARAEALDRKDELLAAKEAAKRPQARAVPTAEQQPSKPEAALIAAEEKLKQEKLELESFLALKGEEIFDIFLKAQQIAAA